MKSLLVINDLGFEKYAKEINLDLQIYPAATIARVIEEYRTRWVLLGDVGRLDAGVRGALHYDLDTEAFPKVGDFVTYTLASDGKATIEEILPRRTSVTRKKVSGQGRQVIVTNVDIVAIVLGTDQEFSVPKLERYLELTSESGAHPVIVITKADMSTDIEMYRLAVEENAPAVPVVVISSQTGDGLEQLAAYLKPQETVVLLGSSGAGKSTLLNALMKTHVQLTQAVRKEDGKGRHTTTMRSLFILPTGALVIDTPGMRELSMDEIHEQNKKDTFEDIVEIAYECEYPNCDHAKSAGCAVLAALESGTLDQKRYAKYIKYLERESKKTVVYAESNTHSERVKSNRANLNYQSRRQSEGE